LGIRIDENACHGCLKLPEARCVTACPGDLIGIRSDNKKAFMRVQADCWDCYACVKMCPVSAVEVVLPHFIAAGDAHLFPKMKRESVRWTLTTPDGRTEIFDAPTRVPEEQLED
jgi:adenylylsulfate reductase subunit B